MDLSSSQVESIVRQVLSEMSGTSSAPKAAAGIPATAKVGQTCAKAGTNKGRLRL